LRGILRQLRCALGDAALTCRAVPEDVSHPLAEAMSGVREPYRSPSLRHGRGESRSRFTDFQRQRFWESADKSSDRIL
jgi:hypothetical protein